jgi:hypothetical protein
MPMQSRRLRLAGMVVAALMAAAPQAAFALSASVHATTSDRRDGVVVGGPEVKVSSTDLPLNQDAVQGFGPVVPSGGSAGASQGTIQFQAQATFVADPGDAPNATMCVSYRFFANVAASVDSATASVAGGIGSPTGASSDSSTQPVTVTIPNPVTLTRTPLVGPVQTLFTAPPKTFATSSGAGNVSINQVGTFQALAGDIVDFAMTTQVVARAEPPAGSATISSSQAHFSLQACRDQPVPALSDAGVRWLAVLVMLTALLAGGFGALRRTRR